MVQKMAIGEVEGEVDDFLEWEKRTEGTSEEQTEDTEVDSQEVIGEMERCAEQREEGGESFEIRGGGTNERQGGLRR